MAVFPTAVVGETETEREEWAPVIGGGDTDRLERRTARRLFEIFFSVEGRRGSVRDRLMVSFASLFSKLPLSLCY